MTAEEFSAFIHPLTFVDAAKLFGVTTRYVKQMAYGERKVNSFGYERQDVLKYLKESAGKSRQQFRNKVTYKEYVRMVGLERYKCRCCCYPASERIYNVPLCEGCVSKINKNKELVK